MSNSAFVAYIPVFLPSRTLDEKAKQLLRVGTHDPDYHTGYLTNMLQTNRLRETVELAKPKLAPILDKFQAFAFRGASGTLISPLLAVNFDKTLIHVRKAGTLSHSGDFVEGDKAAKSYLIVDDQISMGTTIRWIYHHIKKWNPEMLCLGALCINHLHFNLEPFYPFDKLQYRWHIDTPPDWDETSPTAGPSWLTTPK